MGPIQESPSPNAAQITERQRQWSAALFVWGVWGLMVLAALGYVAKYAINVPYADEWDTVVPVITGEEPLSLHYLWKQQNEYRIPLIKVILVGLAKLTHCDFRAGMYASVLSLAATSFLLLIAIRRIRGCLSCLDAIFPLTTLHLGQYENLLMGSQLCYILPVLFLAALLAVVVGRRAAATVWGTAVVGLALLCLPLCGASGVVVVPGLALWLGATGIAEAFLRPQARKGLGFTKVALALGALLLVAAYLYHFERPGYHPSSPSLRATASATLQVLAMALGIAPAWTFWPYSGVVLPVLLAPTLVLLAATGWRQLGERGRCAGLLIFLLAVLSLCVAVGAGRAGLGDRSGLAPRYLVFALPLLWWAYLVWDLYGPPLFQDGARMSLFTVTAAALLLNTSLGWERGQERHQALLAFQHGLSSGQPAPILAVAHAPDLFPWSPERLAHRIESLARAKVGKFRALQEMAYTQLACPTTPGRTNQMVVDGGGWRGTGPDPYLVFGLGARRHVLGVRLQYRLDNGGQPAKSQVYWRDGSRGDGFSEDRRTYHFALKTDPTSATAIIPINDTIDEIRIDPDERPCRFQIEGLWLLLPTSERTVQVCPSPPTNRANSQEAVAPPSCLASRPAPITRVPAFLTGNPGSR
jgi:hypothetical protein